MASSLRARKAAGGSSAAAIESKDRVTADSPARRQDPASAQVFVWGVVGMVILGLAVHYVQSIQLPRPLPAEEAGKLGFSEERAMGHLKVLTSFGPKPVGSENLDHALEYIVRVLEFIKSKANSRVFMEIERFRAKPGRNRLQGGLFKGKTLAYADLSHVLVRLSSKHSDDAEDNAILVSSHVDTVFTSSGGGDCGSCVSSMLELVRALSNIAQGFKHSVVFLFNAGEEEGLDGAHSFITQHHWNSSIRAFIDLEAMGAGGKSKLFQAGPDKWLVDVFAQTARRPSANIVAQDVFQAGLIKSATDFQVYREIAGLSGLDFAYVENGAVYHTQNDALKLVRAGSLQHLGDNILPFLVEVASSPELAHLGTSQSSKLEMVYFDVLGQYMVTFTRDFAKLLYSSVLIQSLLLFVGSMIRADQFSLPALLLAAFGVILSWIFSLSSAVAVAALLPRLCTYSVPYLAHPILAVGLFGAPAVFGGVIGHTLGYKLLRSYLVRSMPNSASVTAETEKFMFKAVFLMWLLVFGLGVWANAGSSYIAMAWLVIPSIAYGLKESSLSKNQAPRQLSSWTLLLGLPVPIVLTSDIFLSLPNVLISNLVRFDRHPGGGSPWVGNAVIAVLISAILCLSLSYLMPYIHRGAGVWISLSTIFIFLVSLSVVSYELVPAFTKDVAKGTYVVHVIEANMDKLSSESYISVSFTTPGGLGKEVQSLAESGFTCGGTERPDFVTFGVRKGCEKPSDLDEDLWQGRPNLTILSDHTVGDQRTTSVLLKTMSSNRWSLSIDTDRIQALQVDIITEETGTKEMLVPKDDIAGIDGVHVLQFASGKNGPHVFNIELVWQKGISAETSSKELLKLRTDLNVLTPDAAKTLKLLPDFCTLFGKSTSPYTLAYLSRLSL
ncbi:endoplasmic reticulum metallopeptidase 1 isoform X1 [Selaginella moellendorffii]|uniref:endoplasmic reticulum metallopeptidase 1 isoform X1 n=2 Tax=Selaginella moellendorffii TaxID=88036 RepID=UPI000D1C9B15|nr:endoplasmic reticulum metallopeptidase 1 isoform X1 [Selaginella moellendorffii]|eukprot:XP_024525642.1 endoplasmic reticulum metallopeptidase 1 isoform X1 [Selaginella moellendorffii]